MSKNLRGLEDKNYTLVNLVVDESGSTMSFRGLIEQSLNQIIESCKEKNKGNILVRTTAFDSTTREVHGFVPLESLTEDYYSGKITGCGGTNIERAATESLKTMKKSADFIKERGDHNGFLFLLTDGEDTIGTNKIKKLMEELKSGELFGSFSAILVGVGIRNGYTSKRLRSVKKQGFDGYIGLKNTGPEEFGKISNFVSRSISSRIDSNEIHDPFKKGFQEQMAMEVNGLKCTLHMPKINKKDDASLPPFAPRPAFAVDEYKNSPDSWMHGSATESSYFVPVAPEHGLWLDFEDNRDNDYDVAVAVSIQGINPITGEKSDPIRLEQYKKMCPKHQKTFLQDRRCEDCKYKWHPQNYLASTTDSPMWLDGWRTQDGEIRQWYFSEEECRSIAGQVIGNDRVYAIGVVFYKSKNKKSVGDNRFVSSGLGSIGGLGGGWYASSFVGAVNELKPNSVKRSMGSYPTGLKGPTGPGGIQGPTGDQGIQGEVGACGVQGGSSSISVTTTGSVSLTTTTDCHGIQVTTGLNARAGGISRTGGGSADIDNVAACFAAGIEASDQTIIGAVQSKPVIQKKLEIAAGAKIQQEIAADPNDLDYWENEPAGFIYINYCDLNTAEEIIQAGRIEEVKEGFLANVNYPALKDGACVKPQNPERV